MLVDTLQSDLAKAQKDRDQIKVDALRFLLGAVFNLQIEKYPGRDRSSLTDADVQSVIAKQIKTHRESIAMFTQAKRDDLVERENQELAILLSYMPAALSEAEVKAKIEALIASAPGSDFGTVMKLAMAKFGGQADGALVAQIVKECLH